MLDLDPPLSPPAKPKLSPAERRARMHDRLTTLRLRVTIGRALDDRGITTPAADATYSSCVTTKPSIRRSSCHCGESIPPVTYTVSSPSASIASMRSRSSGDCGRA